MSPPPQGSTQPQQPQQVDAANIRRVQQKWQPATADTLHHGQPQTPQYNPADRTVAPIPAASAPSANAADTQPAPEVIPVATQPAPVAQPASMAAPQHKTNNTAYAETTPLPPPAPIATRGKNKFGKDQQQPAVVKREETTRQYYGAVPPVAQRSDPPMAVRHTAPVAPVASPQQREVQQPMAAAVAPIGSAPKIATRGLSGFEELFVRGNVRSVAAVTFRGQPRSRANVTSAVTAALLAHPVAFSTIEGGRSVSWQRDVNADGQMCELPHMRFAEEVIAAPERDIAAAALAREMAEVRDASGGIGITLLLKDGFSRAPIAAQTHTASRFDHPRTMVGDETITGQPTRVSHDYLNPGQSAPANERLSTTQYESQAAAATAGSRQAGSAWKPAQRADLEPQHASLYPNNQQFGAQQQHASLYPNNDDVSAQQPQHTSLYPSNNTTEQSQTSRPSAQPAGVGADEDGVVGVIFNVNHALLDATGMKQLVQYFIGLVTQDGAGGRMVTPPEVVMEPSVPLNRDTIPGLRGKHVPTHYLPLDPQARKGRHDDLSSESSLSSEDIQRDFGMYRRLSKAEVKQMKKLEKKEEKFAKEEDEHRYQIEKAEYKELKDISKAEFKEFKRIDKLERKEHKIEDKEMKERSKIEYKEAKDQQQIARKALKYHMPGIMAFDYRDRRSQLVEDRAAHGPQPLTEDLQRNDGRHAGGIYFLRTADICGFAPGTDPKLMAAHTKDSMAHENRDLSEGALFTPDVHAMLERQTLDALRSKSRLPINNTSLIAASLAVACVARAHARGVLSQHLMSYDRVGVTISIPLDLRDRSIVNEPEFVMPGGYVDATGPARRLNFLNCFGTVTVGVEFDGHLFRGRTADEFLKQYDVVGLASGILLDIKDRIARGEAHKDALAVAAGKWTDVAPTGTVELCNHGLYRDAPNAEVTLSQSADPRVFADNKALSITAWSSAAQGTTNLAASMCGEIDRREVNSLMYSAMAALAHASLF